MRRSKRSSTFRRVFTIVLVAAMLTISLLGCGKQGQMGSEGNDGTGVSNQQTDVKGQKVVTHYTHNAPDRVFIKDLALDFEKLHPDIKVNVIAVPFDQFDSKLQTMIASNTSPDVTTHLGWTGFQDYYNKGVLMDLTPLMEASGFDAAKLGIPDNLMKMWQIDGKQYGIPINAYVSLMLYNKDMFDKAGLQYPPSSYEDLTWTWDKMVDYAKKLTINSNDPTKVQYGLIWNWNGGGGFEQDSSYFGHEVFPPETFTTNKGIATENFFGDPDIIADHQKLADLTWKEKVSPPPAFVQGMGGNDPFLAGKVAMEVGGAWLLSGINDVKFNIGVAAVPLGGNPSVRDVLWTDPYWIMKGSKYPETAFEWITFLAQKDTQEKMIQMSGGNPPANMNALDKYCSFFKGVNSDDMQNVVNGGIKYGSEGYSHLMVGAGEIHTLIANEISPVYDGTKKANEVLPTLEEKLNDLLSKIAERNKK